MTMPTVEKTWQFDLHNLIVGETEDVGNQKLLWMIKDKLINFGSTPWTVVGSSDSVSADSIPSTSNDYWVDYTDCVWGVAGVHSWIVLKQTGIASNFQLLLSCETSSTTYYSYRMSVSFSPAAGFTGGSTSAPPTATDEVVVFAPAGTVNWTTANVATNMVVDFMQSTDGQCTRVLVFVDARIVSLICVEKAKNPLGTWTTPSFVLWSTDVDADAVTYALFHDASTKVFSGVSAATTNLYCATIGAGANACGELMTGFNNLSEEYDLYPIWFFSNTAGRRGVLGLMYDCWFGSVIGPHTGDTFPGTGRTHIQLGELVMPWDGATQPITTV